MKFETTQTEKKVIEIPVPSFFRDTICSDKITDMIGLIDSDTVVRVFESERRTSVQNYDSTISGDDLVHAFQKWQPVTEDEFLAVYNRALHSMSLTPELSKNL